MAMLNPKICREHAAKCTQVAETCPPGDRRQMFLDMAAQWRSLAANVESSERLLQDVPANDVGEAYRFGSRIQTKGQEP
jgi:hypothetical protein